MIGNNFKYLFIVIFIGYNLLHSMETDIQQPLSSELVITDHNISMNDLQNRGFKKNSNRYNLFKSIIKKITYRIPHLTNDCICHLIKEYLHQVPTLQAFKIGEGIYHQGIILWTYIFATLIHHSDLYLIPTKYLTIAATISWKQILQQPILLSSGERLHNISMYDPIVQRFNCLSWLLIVNCLHDQRLDLGKLQHDRPNAYYVLSEMIHNHIYGKDNANKEKSQKNNKHN